MIDKNAVVKLAVESYQSSNDRFSPATEPLTYNLDNNTLIMGRNGVCDVYLQLQGTLVTSKITGEYVSIGIRGDQQLGYFTLKHRIQ